MSDSRPRVGIILTGGGARAAYQVGVLRAIAELIPREAGNPFPIISGTSAGAINAVALAADAANFRRAVLRLQAVTTFELAARTGRPVVGVDLGYAMLRLAAQTLREGRVRYPRRRVGLVYDRRDFAVRFSSKENVDFWACDALALPFPPGTFAAVLGLNVLDCVQSPHDLLAALPRLLAPGGKAILSTPYDWSPNATPVEAWLGGHSQRGETAGASEPVLRALLTPGAHPASIEGLRIVAEEPSLPWRVRLHERAVMEYRVDLMVAERAPVRA